MIVIDGKKYKVIENLGYQAGYTAKVILVKGKEKVVVKDHGFWRLWTIKERVYPLKSFLIAQKKAQQK